MKKQFESAGLTEYFDERLSVEYVGEFKLFSDTYAWAVGKMGVKPEEFMLTAVHSWDVAGALWAGWRAAFITKPEQQLFPLAPQTEIMKSDLKGVAEILVTYN